MIDHRKSTLICDVAIFLTSQALVALTHGVVSEIKTKTSLAKLEPVLLADDRILTRLGRTFKTSLYEIYSNCLNSNSD